MLTYRQAADVQPFANTLVNMDLTGAQIKTILEQQWQRDADGNIPSRPFLRLGTSKGFTSTYDAGPARGRPDHGHVARRHAARPGADLLGGGQRRSSRPAVTTSGASPTATNKQDTGKTDLQGVVDYMAEFAEHGVDARCRSTTASTRSGVAFPAGAPAAYEAGDTWPSTCPRWR